MLSRKKMKSSKLGVSLKNKRAYKFDEKDIERGKRFLQDMSYYNKKIDKQIRNSSDTKSFNNCENYCKKTLEDNDKFINKIRKKNKNLTPYNPTKKEKESSFNECKKDYCNPKCVGYNIINSNDELKNKIVDGFRSYLSKKEIMELKKKGVLSRCVF
jgi:hypothetical protein